MIINNIWIRPNHEKIVYSKLLRYREEQLEHYEGPPLEASISDYHHVNPPEKMDHVSSTQASIKLSQAPNRQSQYSLADHHLQPLERQESHIPQRHTSVAETEKTAESYDPFRPSRSQIAQIQADHARITVLRQASQTTGRRLSNSGGVSYHKQSTRLPMTQEAGDGYPRASSPPAMHSSGTSQLQRLLANQRRMSRGNSKITVSSNRTGRSGSSQIVARRRASYKRDVSFKWNCRRSMSSGQPPLRSQGHQWNAETLQERYSKDKARAELQPNSCLTNLSPRETPMPDSQTMIRSKKEGSRITEGSSLSKLHQDPSWTDDVRKVSTELDKLCDTAFNRASISSSARTAITPGSGNRESQGKHLSSATSFSIYEDPISDADDRHVRIKMVDASTRAYPQRPLPPPRTSDPLAEDQLSSYTQRELARTRELLKKRNRASYMEPGYLDDVIAHLDRLMQPSTARLADEERRAVTDPSSKTGLPRKDTFEQIMENGNIGFRSASEPTQEHNKGQRSRRRDHTIRVIEDTGDGYKPISPIKPLTIRKKSGASSTTPSPTTPTKQACLLDRSHALSLHHHDSRPASVSLPEKSLQPIIEIDDLDGADRHRRNGFLGAPMKRSWFRSRHQPRPSRDTAIVPPPVSAKDFQQVYYCSQPQSKKRLSAACEESQRSQPMKGGKGGRFFKIFKGRKDTKSSAGPFQRGSDHDPDDEASGDTEEASMQLHSRELQQRYPALYSPQRSGGMIKQKDTQPMNDGKSHTQDKDSGNESRHLIPRPHDRPTHPSSSTTIAHTRPIQQRAHNWLARFLGIKPAVHVLCFQVNKLRARREIANAFREWRKFGMRDVIVDKKAGRVWARVDGNNCPSPFFPFVFDHPTCLSHLHLSLSLATSSPIFTI